MRAAIDVGTNSVHLLVAKVGAAGGFEVITREKASVRLGAGMGDLRQLSVEAMDRGVEALDRFRQVAEAHGAPITAVATSAVREAENGDDFVRRARIEAGVDVGVISGIEEARLIHLGVVQAIPAFDRQLLVVDIGGGSTELLVGRAGRMLDARSTKLGAIRLTDRFFPDGTIAKGAVKECRRYVMSFLEPVAQTIRALGFQLAVGSSGTISTLAALARRDDLGIETRSFNNETFTRAQLDTVVAELTAARTAKERRRIAGVDERRADIIVGGAILLESVFELLGIDEMVVSDYALREGVLLDAMQQRHGADLHHLADIRRESVLRVAESFREDVVHAQRATDLALVLFDELVSLHGLGLDDRDLLEAAGLLHNVGLFISHAAHHKHSEYVIRSSDRLVGFTQREIEIVAQVARYHRKSAPKPSHLAFAALSPDAQRRVRILSGILRVAIALDRTRQGAVDHVRATVTDGRVLIEVSPGPGADLELELYTAVERSGPLAASLDCVVEIVEEPAESTQDFSG